MSSRYFTLVFLNLLFCFGLKAQSEQISLFNKYIHTSNEYGHGMLIVHRILESLNQEVNKFVDLQSSQFNFYGNKDLPKDIFMDPEGWFFEIPPTVLKEELMEYDQILPSPEQKELFSFIEEMAKLSARANALRFELESFINDNDLRDEENQIKVFKKLETCEYVYDRFFEVKESLHRYIDSLMEAKNFAALSANAGYNTFVFSDVQKKMKSILEFWHFGIEKSIMGLRNEISKDHEYIRSLNFSNRYLDDLKAALGFSLEVVDRYLDGNEIPQRYDLYGRSYFYHNVELLSTLNKYGKGFVINSNKFLKATSPNSLFIFEEPHYFKVVYPKKEVDINNDAPQIDLLPSKVEERKVVIKKQSIEVESNKVLLEIFDHKKEDGDIVSLNFNGKWILKKKKLAKRPFKFVIELNEKGENYLLLHAENLGEIPPNTIAVRYYLEGRPKLVVLNSDLDQSEMILLKSKSE